MQIIRGSEPSISQKSVLHLYYLLHLCSSNKLKAKQNKLEATYFNLFLDYFNLELSVPFLGSIWVGSLSYIYPIYYSPKQFLHAFFLLVSVRASPVLMGYFVITFMLKQTAFVSIIFEKDEGFSKIILSLLIWCLEHNTKVWCKVLIHTTLKQFLIEPRIVSSKLMWKGLITKPCTFALDMCFCFNCLFW